MFSCLNITADTTTKTMILLYHNEVTISDSLLLFPADSDAHNVRRAGPGARPQVARGLVRPHPDVADSAAARRQPRGLPGPAGLVPYITL